MRASGTAMGASDLRWCRRMLASVGVAAVACTEKFSQKPKELGRRGFLFWGGV